MRIKHRAAILRMILRAHIPLERWDFHHFHQMGFRVFAHTHHAGCLKLSAEFFVKFVAMAMTLRDIGTSVCFSNFRATLQMAGITAQTHCATHIGDTLLLLHQVNHIIGCVGVHLGTVGRFHTEHIACKFHHHALHTQTNAKGGHIVGAAPFQRHIFAFSASLAESGRHYHAIHTGKFFFHIAIGESLRTDVLNFHFVVAIGGGLKQRFINRFVSILQFHIFAHQPYGELLGGIAQVVEIFVPRPQIGFSGEWGVGFLQYNIVEFLLVHHQGHLIDGRRIHTLHHRIFRHITELCHLAEHTLGNVHLGAKHQHIGLNTHLLKLLHGVLRGLGFQFFSRTNVGHIGEVNAHALPTELPAQLTHSFEERQRLDITHRATYFGNHKVVFAIAAKMLHRIFNFIGDVGHHLHGFSQIVAATLFINHTLINSTRGHIAGTRSANIGKAFVMTQVKVRLVAIFGYITFAMFVGIEGAGVNIDIGVEFLNRYIETT